MKSKKISSEEISLLNLLDRSQNLPSSETSANDLFTQNFKNRKVHLAIEYLRRLQLSEPSIQLKEFLSNFDRPRPVDSETFTKGIKKFIKLANSNPLDKSSEYGREAFYGNSYLGLHYNNDLVKLWNTSESDKEPIDASHVSILVPSGWDATNQNGFNILIYKGQHPAQALDDLVKGPTVIDCGMFTQLCFWFGIRYLLGNDRFNQCFGQGPFFITQLVYNDIKESDKPYLGSPLYSFLSTKDQAASPSVTVKHLANTPLYRLKHPGGIYGGENCILIDNQYYIFGPHLAETQGLTELTILNLLRQSFNDERDKYDSDRLSRYASIPDQFHPEFSLTYAQLIDAAEKLRDAKLTEEEFHCIKQSSFLELTFDLHKFSAWLQRMENKEQFNSVSYSPLPIDYSLIPNELLKVIPFENKTSMDFSKFKEDTLEQKELMAISKHFCHRVMEGKSNIVILSGKAGVGKTASAVCAAKELAAKGKKIVWISEVMVKGWADQAKSMADLGKCELEIDSLLATDPDVVFLDDDNLTGFSGEILFEKIYAWYVSNPNKAVFITSNANVNFKDCYGYQLDGKYHYPPFSSYDSSQYLNWNYKTNLSGQSLRSKREGQSIGAIVSDSAWKANEALHGNVELIPAFDEETELVPIRRSLLDTGTVGSTYDKLRPIQKSWIHVHEVGGMYIPTFDGQSLYEEPFLTANPLPFEKTNCKTIALEIGKYESLYNGKQIDSNCMNQLIRVLNYAHDQGGRRVILINQTSYSSAQLLQQIKSQLPKSESERTWSRLTLLLCETEDSIFKYDELNGHVENTVIEDKSIDKKHLDLSHKSLPRHNSTYLFNDLMNSMSFEFIEDSYQKIDAISKKINLIDLPFLLNIVQGSPKSVRKRDGLNVSWPEEKVAKKLSPEKNYFGKFFKEQEGNFLIQHRHNNAELQHEYDKRFGVILKN